jgi:hypothetical protein
MKLLKSEEAPPQGRQALKYILLLVIRILKHKDKLEFNWQQYVV